MMKVLQVMALALVAGCAPVSIPGHTQPSLSERGELQTQRRIPQLMDAFGVTGMAVTAVAGDEILLAQGFGETQDGAAFTSSTSCGLFSATKVLASLTYAKLAGAGRIKLDAPLGAYISDAPAAWKDIPFYRLLNHTSGITMAVNQDAFAALSADPQATNASVYRMIRDEPLDYQPGEFSRYRQSGYAIGEMILQDQLSKDFAALIRDNIVEPAGLSATQHPALDDAAQPSILLSAGGFQTTADDMARLFLAINDRTVIDPADWKAVLLQDDHLFGDYSLGSVIEKRSGILTVGHSGGGARANIRYAPDEGVGVMVCTDDRSNNWLAIELARMLVQEIATGEVPPSPLLVALSGYADMTGAQVIAAYETAEGERGRYDFSNAEQILNEIGYGFLADKKAQDAIAVLQFNADTFPLSPNAHDSLGEALLVSGDADAALMQYRRVLELDPENANALKMIAGILSDN